MESVLTIFNAILLFIIGGFHFYWALGGKVGANVALPEINNGKKVFVPGAIATFVVGGIFSSFGIITLNAGQLLTIELPNIVAQYDMIALGIIFVIRAVGEFKYVGFFKTVKGTPFAIYDTKYFSPLSLLMGIVFLIIYLLK